ncbi:MAG: thioredoxin-dependent thiol peroxidase [Armatimonadota bacterium]|nr:MAG: thioredoxin-dependent thiol peroxidase [Armatimonadota bacterium]
MPKLKPGDAAPKFALTDQNGKTVKLADFKGTKLLVYFYPRAGTTGCTKQSQNVRDHRAALRKLGVEVAGISPDTPEQQKRFDDKHKFGFPLLSDADHAVAQAWGAWGEKSMYGRKFQGVIRSSFLVDEKGKIAHAWYKVKPEQTAPEVEKALRAK